MKKKQVIISVKYEANKVKFLLPEGVTENNASFFLVNKGATVPVRKIYAQTFWILNAGHDFSISKGYFQSSSDIFKTKDLLIEFGEEAELNCNHCQAKVEEVFNFCTDCGKKIDWNQILKDNISTI